MTEHDALRAALAAQPGLAGLAGEIEALPVRGLQHRLYRVRGVRRLGAGVLLRVPRQSFWGLAPQDALAYQETAFRRASPSGAVPRLFGAIAPSPALPWGALAVEEIEGRAPDLPRDLGAIAGALAAIHALPLPPRDERAPLTDQENPAAAAVAIIEKQAEWLDAAQLSPLARSLIEEERQWAREFAARGDGASQPRALAMTDTQPGNFVVTADGRAVCVDLEKAVYGAIAIDIAHVTLAPSARWDAAITHTPTAAEARAFERRYLSRLPREGVDALAPWLAPMRRLTWLRTITIFAKMRAELARGSWTGLDLDPAFRAHVVAHIGASHAPAAIARDRAEWTGR